MGGCQNYGPFLGYPKYWVPYYNRDPKGDQFCLLANPVNCELHNFHGLLQQVRDFICRRVRQTAPHQILVQVPIGHVGCD